MHYISYKIDMNSRHITTTENIAQKVHIWTVGRPYTCKQRDTDCRTGGRWLQIPLWTNEHNKNPSV